MGGEEDLLAKLEPQGVCDVTALDSLAAYAVSGSLSGFVTLLTEVLMAVD